jgi:hypothetical protein
MKPFIRYWYWFAGLVAVVFVCASYLLGQIQLKQNNGAQNTNAERQSGVLPPDGTETADAALLVEAVNAGEITTALKLLHAYGVSEDTLLAMATRLGKAPPRAHLNEPFLRATHGALAMSDPATKAYAERLAVAQTGYQRPVLVVRRLNRGAIANYDFDLAQCQLAPIAVLNISLDDPRFIRFFLWYDRYADQLHSVAINGENLNNAKLDVENYGRACRTLNALFQLIKARNPDAFVWLYVVKQDSRSDEQWLKAMTFQPDGLLIGNLRQFHSPFAQTRQRYAAIVGSDMPMMIYGFYGQKVALEAQEKMLAQARDIKNPKARQAAEARVLEQMGAIGAAIESDFVHLESELQSVGYRGLSMHWSLQAALANSRAATLINRSELVDSGRARLLEAYFTAKDYDRVLALCNELISNSVPGDMNWMMGKLYQGMALVSQQPPNIAEACAVLDELLASDVGGKLGRDHYVIEAVKWRIYAAWLAGEPAKIQELANSIWEQHWRADLKSDFWKWYMKYYRPQIKK